MVKIGRSAPRTFVNNPVRNPEVPEMEERFEFNERSRGTE